MSSSILRHASRWSTCILTAAILAGASTLGTIRTAHAEERVDECFIRHIAVAPGQYVEVKCHAKIETYVVPATDPSANRVLSAASMAALLKKTVSVRHDSLPSGVACPLVNVNFCRVIRTITLKV